METTRDENVLRLMTIRTSLLICKRELDTILENAGLIDTDEGTKKDFVEMRNKLRQYYALAAEAVDKAQKEDALTNG